jgi:hypothetical protein
LLVLDFRITDAGALVVSEGVRDDDKVLFGCFEHVSYARAVSQPAAVTLHCFSYLMLLIFLGAALDEISDCRDIGQGTESCLCGGPGKS